MGCSVSISAGAVSVRGPTRLKAVHCDLGDAPDLFPVLSALCAIADGESILDGAPQLAHKESDRLSKSEELVRLMGAEVHRVQGGLSIRGTQKRTNFRFHPDHDHRMAMAAACARRAGYGVEIEDIDVVDKSFPGFWKIANDIHPKANQEAQ
jgi:3-phosphoshikimate 1-carboxyvinyltransferase